MRLWVVFRPYLKWSLDLTMNRISWENILSNRPILQQPNINSEFRFYFCLWENDARNTKWIYLEIHCSLDFEKPYLMWKQKPGLAFICMGKNWKLYNFVTHSSFKRKIISPLLFSRTRTNSMICSHVTETDAIVWIL